MTHGTERMREVSRTITSRGTSTDDCGTVTVIDPDPDPVPIPGPDPDPEGLPLGLIAVGGATVIGGYVFSRSRN